MARHLTVTCRKHEDRSCRLLKASMGLYLIYFASSQQSVAQSTLSSPERKIDVQGAIGAGRTLPVVSNGYLLSYARTMTVEKPSNIVITSLDTLAETAVPFVLPGASSATIYSMTITAAQHVVIAGQFTRTDYTVHGFITVATLGGGIMTTIETGAYSPMRVCATNDGTLWALGQNAQNESLGVPYDILTSYTEAGVQKPSHLARASIGQGALDLLPMGRNSNPNPTRVFLDCHASVATAYFGAPFNTMYQVNAVDGSIGATAISPPATGALSTFLINSAGTAMAVVTTRSQAAAQLGGNLYYLSLGSAGQPASWKPTVVVATPGEANNPPIVLLGSDGTSIVHVRGSIEPSNVTALYWSQVQ